MLFLSFSCSTKHTSSANDLGVTEIFENVYILDLRVCCSYNICQFPLKSDVGLKKIKNSSFINRSRTSQRTSYAQ